jgi:DNA-directed RNA polymerase subunit alpha
MLDNVILSPTPPENVPDPLPGIRVIESGDTYGKIAVEPLKKGFGITIGNPMRRILLSSIKGCAITRVKIDNVVHEYTAIPGVKEEVMDLLLNIKRIRINSQSDRPGKMRLEVTGQGRVCAGDIATSADFQIVNPELHLATLDSEDAALSIEFTVEQGVGYQSVDQQDGSSGLPVGDLPIDAVFSPVRKVNYGIKHTRVGQKTDYEQLLLDIWTDGTITPVEAVREAAASLLDHFHLFRNLDRGADSSEARPVIDVSPEVYQTPIDRLELSPRTLNCLKRAHITRVGEVLEMSEEDLLKIRNFGDKSLEELYEKLDERGIATFPKSTFRPLTGDGAAGGVGTTVVGLAGLAEAWNEDSLSDDDTDDVDDYADSDDEEDTA